MTGTFYIVEGEDRLPARRGKITAGVGDFVNVPRGSVHCFHDAGVDVMRMILTFTPAGIETFFKETLERALDPTQPPPDNVDEVAARYAAAAPRYGILSAPLASAAVDHLAIPVSDQDRSRAFYERYFGFGAVPARRYDDGVLMLYDEHGFALALGPAHEPIARPEWMHFGVGLPDRDAVLALRDRLAADGVELVEEWDEPDYVSVKCRDPDGYIVEASWEPPPRSSPAPA